MSYEKLREATKNAIERIKKDPSALVAKLDKRQSSFEKKQAVKGGNHG